MNRFLFAFVKILEWLTDGAHISKNQIHYIVNEAAISCNVGVTTFGPPCTYVHSMLIVTIFSLSVSKIELNWFMCKRLLVIFHIKEIPNFKIKLSSVSEISECSFLMNEFSCIQWRQSCTSSPLAPLLIGIGDHWRHVNGTNGAIKW